MKHTGIYTPWGYSDYKEIVTDGITKYGTPSHGGIKVKAALNHKIPEYMRKDDGWYEEDCDWAIVAICFPEHFTKEYDQALETFKNWHPAAFERYFNYTLKPGESYLKDHPN